MSITGIILAAVIVGGTGLFIGVFLGISGKKFAVDVDEREEAVLEALPGNNCGGCGYAGCSGLAAAIVKGEAEVGGCPVGGAPVAEKIGKIMGVDAAAKERMTAFVKCSGTCEKAGTEYEYYGIRDCVMASQMQDGGAKGCDYGCLGYGTCVEACPFDAIHIADGIAVVDRESCKACGKCVSACPKHLIELIPYRVPALREKLRGGCDHSPEFPGTYRCGKMYELRCVRGEVPEKGHPGRFIMRDRSGSCLYAAPRLLSQRRLRSLPCCGRAPSHLPGQVHSRLCSGHLRPQTGRR